MGVLAIVVKSLQELTDKVNTLAQGAVGQVGAIGAGIFERLTVGSSDRPIGITLYDEVTGVAHCLKVRNGITITSAGVCPDAQAPENQNNNPENPPTEEPTTDTTPPTITINGNNPANIFVGSVYADLGAIFSDNIDQNLTTYTFLNGATTTDVVIDTATAGTHTVTYTAQDDEGNTASAERIVIVEQQAVVPEVPPEVPPQETP
jgi:hypothetical protein